MRSSSPNTTSCRAKVTKPSSNRSSTASISASSAVVNNLMSGMLWMFMAGREHATRGYPAPVPRKGGGIHVPDTIAAVPAIPRTLTGKKLEAPVKRILRGAAADSVASRGALLEPGAIDAFVQFSEGRGR